jgi:hypothetical protein
MRAEALAGAVGIAGLMLGALASLPGAPVVQLRVHAAAAPAAAFPPAPAPRALRVSAHGGGPAVLALDREIARLGRAPPRLEPLRRAFAESRSLAQFALDRLPRALEGDGASQYFIYLALDQCRSYLRSDFDGVNASHERLLSLPDLTAEERMAAQAEYERCRGFALQDWGALGAALGDDQPGAEVEYASVWFERAMLNGYPPALVEQALRLAPLGAEERSAMLRQGLAEGGADAYWLLFAHSGEVQAGEVTEAALAWLIVACRAGQDCGEDARWYRGFVCMQEERRCAAGQSALEYYWNVASPAERDSAWTQAFEIEENISTAQWNDLPLPDLASRDSQRLWAAPDS